jgi:hypothetical protein
VWEVAVDFVGAYMVVAEVGFFGVFQGLPVLASGFQQGVGADDISFDELCRAIYGTIYVAFGCQVHDGVWLVLGQYAVYFGAIADVDLFESVTLAIAHFSQTFEVAGVGKLIEVDHFIPRVLDDVSNDGRADEAGAAGD